MSWILVIMLLGNTSQSGKATSSIEFQSERSCKDAAVQIEEKIPRTSDLKYYTTSGPIIFICVKK